LERERDVLAVELVLERQAAQAAGPSLEDEMMPKKQQLSPLLMDSDKYKVKVYFVAPALAALLDPKSLHAWYRTNTEVLVLANHSGSYRV
jgi:hypothetical protein